VQHRLQFHHVIPKALLTKKAGVTRREADDIANLAFIGGKTNRAISDKAPALYLPLGSSAPAVLHRAGNLDFGGAA